MQKWTYVPSEDFSDLEGQSLGYESTLFPFFILAVLTGAAFLIALVEFFKRRAHIIEEQLA